MQKKKATKAAAAGALVLAGLGGGFALAISGAADAAPSTAYGQGGYGPGGRGDRPAETPLTGATADKVKAAVLAKYPGATVERLETDSGPEGVYEAHITTKAGEHLTVLVGKDFTVTGTQQGGPGGHGPGRGGPGGRGHDETPLTGTTAAKVKAAALAKYPGATVERLEQDGDGGVYEAHLTTKDGKHVRVAVDKDFKVTDTETFEPGDRGPGGPGHGHGHGPDGDGDGATPPTPPSGSATPQGSAS